VTCHVSVHKKLWMNVDKFFVCGWPWDKEQSVKFRD